MKSRVYVWGMLLIGGFSLLSGMDTNTEIPRPPDTVFITRIKPIQMEYDSAPLKAYDSLLKVYRCQGKKL